MITFRESTFVSSRSRTSYCFGIALLMIANAAIAQDVDFNRDVRPILSDKCFACHGPDASSREAELRLDQREDAILDRDGHAAVVAGKPDASELIARVSSSDESDRMPPPEAGKALSAKEVSTLKRWIEQGAKWQDHWAYLPPNRPDVPDVKKAVGSPIDAFIRQQQIDAGVSMNQKADRRTLIRRLSFDITGLPPTPEDVDAFQSDTSADAYEKLVDRLLQSPRYGERMTMYWLDLVRYADTLGFHGDQVRSVSPYRDYVIDAFNSNKPFDEFTIEQLAGDLLTNPTLSQKVASTYNRINRASAEGGVQPKEYLAKYSADRVRTAGSVWLGSTFGCAECHDHKFDPFTTKDFYSFAAFFADIKEQGIVGGANHLEKMPVPTPEQKNRQAELTSQIAKVETEYNKSTPELTSAFEQWKVDAKAASERWVALVPETAKSTNGATLTIEEEGVVAVSGKNPDKDTYKLEFTTNLTAIGAVRLDVLSHDSLPAKGPGRAGNGNFVVQSIDVELDGSKLAWATANATHNQGGFTAENIAKDNKTGWAILPEIGKDHHLVLEAKEAMTFATGKETPHRFTVSIIQNHGTFHTLGRFRISIAEQSSNGKDSVIPTIEVAKILELPEGEISKEQNSLLQKAFREQTPLLVETRDQLTQLRKEKQQLDASVVTTLVTVAQKSREMRVLPRGDWMSNAGDVVTPAVPAFLSNDHLELQPDRLGLANWLTAPENPLVARTFVNRLWMLLNGYGLCRSVDDLGSQGEWPTHLELLDWLAVEFVESDWNVKQIIKLIVMSETYQQSSNVTEGSFSKDPYNTLFARQTRQRLDAEMIRDNALAISGLLVDKVGGVSAKPYQPSGYWAQLNFPKRTYKHDTGENQYRRGLYTHWQRTFLHPSLLAFDAPAREECTARRERSNTPLQALVLLNDPTYVESARVLAADVCSQSEQNFESRLEYAFRRCLARKPNAEETKVLRQLYDEEFERFSNDEAAITQFLSTGLAPVNEKQNKAEVAAWTGVTRVLLNLHETITRY